jgi:hypothetical protein
VQRAEQTISTRILAINKVGASYISIYTTIRYNLVALVIFSAALLVIITNIP